MARISTPCPSFAFPATTTTTQLRTTAYNISLPPLPLTSVTPLSFRMASSGSIGRGANVLSAVEPQSKLGEPSVLLEVRDLKARMKKSGQEILHGVNLIIKEGETHVIIGKYGSGKSIFFAGINLLDMTPQEKSDVGLFTAFHTPEGGPVRRMIDHLQLLDNGTQKITQEEYEICPHEFKDLVNPKIPAPIMDPKSSDSLLTVVVQNEWNGFFKYLEADLAILDEIDSTSSYDALLAKALNVFMTSKKSALIITHHLGLLDHISPNFVHIMENGKILETVNTWIAKQLEKARYFELRPPFY